MSKILTAIAVVALVVMGSVWALSSRPQNEASYQEIIDHTDNRITEIISSAHSIEPWAGKWFAEGYWFTSRQDAYVDFEDGHILRRILLTCDLARKVTCESKALFRPTATDEEHNSGTYWYLVEGKDSQKDKPIIFSSASYDWIR